MSLVDTSWLESNIDKVKIIDCSWHMPQTQRNGFKEYCKEHISNAIFFDYAVSQTILDLFFFDLNAFIFGNIN